MSCKCHKSRWIELAPRSSIETATLSKFDRGRTKFGIAACTGLEMTVVSAHDLTILAMDLGRATHSSLVTGLVHLSVYGDDPLQSN